MAEALKGAVGLQTKNGPKVANNPEDVDLVRRILRANGYKVPETGPAGPDIYKALKDAAEKAGITQDAAVIEPNSDLMKALKPKYERAKKAGGDGAAGSGRAKGGGAKAGGAKDGGAKGEDEKVDVYKVTAKSGTYVFTEQNYEIGKQMLFKSLARYVRQLERVRAQNKQVVIDYMDMMAWRDGMVQGIAVVLVVKNPFSKVTFPNSGILRNCDDAVLRLGKVHAAGKDLKALHAALDDAERWINAANKEVDRFVAEFTKSAGNATAVASVTAGVGFAVLGAMATPLFVAGGMTATAAAGASGAALGFVKSAATEFGGYTAGDKAKAFDRLWNIGLDTIGGGLTGLLSGKIDEKFTGDLTKKVAGGIAAKFGTSADKLMPFVSSVVMTSGKEVIKASLGEVVDESTAAAKSGKDYKAGDLRSKIEKVVIAAIMGPISAKLGQASDKATEELTKELPRMEMKKILEVAMKGGKASLDKKMEEAVVQAAWASCKGEVVKTAFSLGLEQAKGGESPGQLAALTLKQARGDSRIQKMLEKAVEAELEKKLRKAR